MTRKYFDSILGNCYFRITGSEFLDFANVVFNDAEKVMVTFVEDYHEVKDAKFLCVSLEVLKKAITEYLEDLKSYREDLEEIEETFEGVDEDEDDDDIDKGCVPAFVMDDLRECRGIISELEDLRDKVEMLYIEFTRIAVGVKPEKVESSYKILTLAKDIVSDNA